MLVKKKFGDRPAGTFDSTPIRLGDKYRLMSKGYSEPRLSQSERMKGNNQAPGKGRKGLMKQILRRMKREGFFAFENDAAEAIKND